MGDAEKAHVIAHEMAHIARRDHWWKPLAFALLTVNWFNPAMWLAYILLCRDIEMACDERVVEGLTVSDKKAYSAALLQCSVKARYVTACPLAFGEVGVKERVKSVLNYKKPAFWIVAVTLILALVLGVGLLTSPESEKAELKWNGLHYIQEGRPVRTLPERTGEAGTLRSVLHEPALHPSENSQAINLDWEYAGQPVYLLDEMLYLEQPGGGAWLPFRQSHTVADFGEFLDSKPQCELAVRRGEISMMEYLSTAQVHLIRELLCETEIEFTPYPEWTQMLAINGEYGESELQFTDLHGYRQAVLFREEGQWILVYQSADYASSAWRFGCPELDAWLQSWERELSAAEALFLMGVGGAQNVEFVGMDLDGFTLRCAIPRNLYVTGDDSGDWEYQGHVSHTGKTVTLSLRPFGCGDWMNATYYVIEAPAYDAATAHMPITLPTGATGTLYHSGDPSHWELLILDVMRGQLHITSPAAQAEWDWADEDFQTALTVLSTLNITENGASLLGQPNRMGLSLNVSDVTPQGLTLHCTQDGTSVAELLTGTPWWIEMLVDGEWVHLCPRKDTAWTTVAFSIPIGGTRDFHIDWTLFTDHLEPGTYRVAKSFFAKLTPVTVLSPDPETVNQIYYAEFTVE